jgi:hypothetical protein
VHDAEQPQLQRLAAPDARLVVRRGIDELPADGLSTTNWRGVSTRSSNSAALTISTVRPNSDR